MAEIRQLRYFVAVAERGSVSRAAVDLHLSQSALSETLRKLDVELGVDLLERSSRGVAPTPVGDALLACAREAVDRFDAALLARRRCRAPASRSPASTRRCRRRAASRAACASASRRPARPPSPPSPARA